MEKEIIDLIIQVEEDLASFYKRVKDISRLDSAKDTFQYMIEESFQHAKSIERFKTKFDKPTFQQTAVLEITHKVRDTLFTTIIQEKNFNRAIDEMAGMEENIGKIYISIANFYLKLSGYYKELSDDINRIAGEEMEHKEKLIQKKQKIG